MTSTSKTNTATKNSSAISQQWLEYLPAIQGRFLARAIQYHAGDGRMHLTPKGYVLTPEGVKWFAGRKAGPEWVQLQMKGGKTPKGRAYLKAPPGGPAPFLFPFGTVAASDGESKAAFAAMMMGGK